MMSVVFFFLLALCDCLPQPLNSFDLVAFNDPSISADASLLPISENLGDDPSGLIALGDLSSNDQNLGTFNFDTNADVSSPESDPLDGLIALNGNINPGLDTFSLNGSGSELFLTDSDPETELQLAQNPPNDASGSSSQSSNLFNTDHVSAAEWVQIRGDIKYVDDVQDNWFPSACSRYITHRLNGVSGFEAVVASGGVENGMLYGDIRRWQDFSNANTLITSPLCKRTNWYCCIDPAGGTGCFNLFVVNPNLNGFFRCD